MKHFMKYHMKATWMHFEIELNFNVSFELELSVVLFHMLVAKSKHWPLDLGYPGFSIIETLPCGPEFFMNINKTISWKRVVNKTSLVCSILCSGNWLKNTGGEDKSSSYFSCLTIIN